MVLSVVLCVCLAAAVVAEAGQQQNDGGGVSSSLLTEGDEEYGISTHLLRKRHELAAPLLAGSALGGGGSGGSSGGSGGGGVDGGSGGGSGGSGDGISKPVGGDGWGGVWGDVFERTAEDEEVIHGGYGGGGRAPCFFSPVCVSMSRIHSPRPPPRHDRVLLREDRVRDASAYIRRHQVFALAPVSSSLGHVH
jgi:hypothetical protein